MQSLLTRIIVVEMLKKFKLTYDCDDVTHIFLGANRHGMYENISNRNKVGYIRNFIQKDGKEGIIYQILMILIML